MTVVMLHCSHAYAQKEGQQLIDSILKALPGQQEDTNKVLLLDDLVTTYADVQAERGITWGEKELALAQKLDWKKGMALAYSSLGCCYITGSEYSKAIDYFSKALEVTEELGDDVRSANILGNISICYSSQSDYPKALEYLFRALKIFEKLNKRSRIATAEGNIGIVYQFQNNYPKALEYMFAAIKIYEELKEKDGLAVNYGNIGIVYNYQSEFKKALHYDSLALKLNEEVGNTDGVACNMGNLGNVFANLQDYTRAIEYSLRSNELAEKVNNKSRVIANLENIGTCYLNMAKDSSRQNTAEMKAAHLKKAIGYFDTVISRSKETGDLNMLQEAYKYRSDAEELSGNFSAALASHKQFVTIKDSVFNADNKVKMANQETKREAELKEKQIEINKVQETKKRNERFFLLVGIFVLFVIVFIVVRNNKLISVEKRKSEELLLNILPAEVADELKAKGSADAKLIDEVTVLFTDFKGFTQLSEKLSPQTLVAVVNECFSAFDHIMQRYGVEKIKTIGDAYMAAGGLPTPNNTHADDVVRAALEIQQYMHEHKLKKEAAGELFFEIRIGIHTGPVVAGIVGVKKFQYDIWGDTVNTASRMESSGEVGKVNISGATYELIKDKFNCVYRGEVQAKGKGNMQMYFVS